VNSLSPPAAISSIHWTHDQPLVINLTSVIYKNLTFAVWVVNS